MYDDLKGTLHLRLLHDTIQGRNMFVYKYFKDDLLSLMRYVDLPGPAAKLILKNTLRGLAALHAKNIVHTGE